MTDDITVGRASSSDDTEADRSNDQSTTDQPASGQAPTGGLASTRRRYLVGAAAFGLSGAAGAFSQTVRAETFADKLASYADRFDTIIDVTEAGADNTGGESITKVLKKHADDDTLLVFPPGEYYVDDQLRFTGFANFGMVGNDATIVPANVHEYDGPQYRLFRLGVHYNPGRDLLFEGFTIDQSADDTGVRVVEAYVDDGLEVRDVTVVGRHDSGAFGPGLFCVTNRSGHGVVERFEAADGAAWVEDTPDPLGLWRGPSGILMGVEHRGTLEFRDCVLGGFPDNGLYGCTNGTVRVLGGHYRNSEAASIRLAGTDCLVRGTTVTVDENPPRSENQRGIRLDAGAGFLVDDVTIDLPAPNGHAITVMGEVDSARVFNTRVNIGERVNHGIVVSPGAGPTDIVETNIQIRGGGNAIKIDGSDEGPVVVERVQIWGDAKGATFRHAINCCRDDCEFRGVQIWQPGTHYRRALVLSGDDCLVYNCELESSHHPLWINGDGAWVESNYAESYSGYKAIRLNDSSSNATVKRNTLVNGVLDKGCDGLRMYGNEIV